MQLEKQSQYSLRAIAISTMVLLLLLCAGSYMIYPDTLSFALDSISPVTLIEASLFSLRFGFGLSSWLSIMILLLILLILFRLIITVVNLLLRLITQKRPL